MKKSTKYLKIGANLFVFLLILCFIFFILPKILVFFMPFVIGFILSLIADPLVKFLEKRIKIKRKYGTVLLIILVIGALVLLCYGAGLALVIGLRGFMEYLPTMYENAAAELSEASERLQAALHRISYLRQLDVADFGSVLQDAANSLLSNYKEPTVSAIGDIAGSIPDMFVKVIMGLVATYFFIADRERLLAAIEQHMPEHFRQKTLVIYTQILRAVGGYFKAQFKIMGVIYVVITVGLIILKVNYAWLIGFAIAFLDMLPVFGTGTVLVPWAAIKVFSGNFTTAAGMVVLYGVSLVVHQVIQPKLVGESVGLDPFVTLFFMYIGYQFKGVLGMIIAIPVGMIVFNLYEAGAFDRLRWCAHEIGRDFAEICRIDAGQRVEKEKRK